MDVSGMPSDFSPATPSVGMQVHVLSRFAAIGWLHSVVGGGLELNRMPVTDSDPSPLRKT
jgi:hypothetical protein